jgi:D-arabinose 1-dehydrogenase-like Zn-dependent alcohol dehydrogenase
MVRMLSTQGQGVFEEIHWDKPDIAADEIEVQAVFTGVCRSDVDMMLGEFPLLPMHMHGHEGLGRVTRVGSNITEVTVGDYVATRGEPAYADFYNVRRNEFVTVPAADPKYILEPVACGINVVYQASNVLNSYPSTANLCILGSGFLAWVAYRTLRIQGYEFDITVVGRSNMQRWTSVNDSRLKILPALDGTAYDIVIDLKSDSTAVFNGDIVKNNATLILAAEKHPAVTTTFGNLLWKACTIIMPSPRTLGFIECMKMAKYWIETDQLDIGDLWTTGYNRDTEWERAFSDAVVRPANYSRGYIAWNIND